MTFCDTAGACPSATTIITVPGLDNSGPGHWQTLWEQRLAQCRRADLGDWSHPHRNGWVSRLGLAIRQAGAPVVLVAHSLGCLTVAWWAAMAGAEAAGLVTGALLVAPPDVDGLGAGHRLAGFAPAPRVTLPFRSILVASRDDPWADYEAVARLGRGWGSDLVDAGAVGHVNAESGLGHWAEGQRLLARLLPTVPVAGGAPAIRFSRGGTEGAVRRW